MEISLKKLKLFESNTLGYSPASIVASTTSSGVDSFGTKSIGFSQEIKNSAITTAKTREVNSLFRMEFVNRQNLGNKSLNQK